MAEEGEGYRLIQNSDSISEGPLRVVFLFASSCPLLALADMSLCAAHLRFRGQSGHQRGMKRQRCPNFRTIVVFVLGAASRFVHRAYG
jgi:hypothetical protein